ncbi:MAG: hypothetical protein AAFN10_11565 [Bacteroidota bacterium]
MKDAFRLLLVIFVLPILFSCNRNQIQAENSLEGDWTVVAINSYYGNFDSLSFDVNETIEESGNLGSFSFSERTVDFSFTRNDTLFSANTNWTLSAAKVNAGFFRVPAFSLELEDEYAFDVSFEDETKNAERDAANVRFNSNLAGPSAVYIEMSLEKD